MRVARLIDCVVFRWQHKLDAALEKLSSFNDTARFTESR
jgi:hypothetical protein